MPPSTDLDAAPDLAEIGDDEPDKPDEVADVPAPAGPPPLAERHAQILAFERQWWRRPGAKDQAIRDTFDLPVTRYYQLLNRLLDDPAALAADPVLVNRLRRLRTHRREPGHTLVS
jgi:hypothetical protein